MAERPEIEINEDLNEIPLFAFGIDAEDENNDYYRELHLVNDKPELEMYSEHTVTSQGAKRYLPPDCPKEKGPGGFIMGAMRRF